MARLTPEVGEFLTRLTRLDPQALVRIRDDVLWSRVPWDVLVTRAATDVGKADPDVTVSAAAWLAGGDADVATLPRLDTQWRASMPLGAGIVLETMPTAVVRGVSQAAATTLRETSESGLSGRAVGSRVIRDALLDHVPIVVTPDVDGAAPVEVPQRLVQAVARMGFLGPPDEPLSIVARGAWVGISTGRGTAWWRRPVGLSPRKH